MFIIMQVFDLQHSGDFQSAELIEILDNVRALEASLLYMLDEYDAYDDYFAILQKVHANLL